MKTILQNRQFLFILVVVACTPRAVESPAVRPDASVLPAGTSTTIAPEWKRLQVTPLSPVTKGLVDSVITVRMSQPGDVEVIYTFNNSCQVTMDAYALREADTLLVRFRPRMKPEGNPVVGDLPLCPSVIQMEAFSARIADSKMNFASVRVFAGNDTSWGLVRQYAVPHRG